MNTKQGDIIVTIQRDISLEEYLAHYVNLNNNNDKLKIKIKQPSIVAVKSKSNNNNIKDILKTYGLSLEDVPVIDDNIITHHNFESKIQYPKVDATKIDNHVRPDLKLDCLGNNKVLDISNLDIKSFKGTARIQTPSFTRKLYCKELNIISSDINKMLLYIDCLQQLKYKNYDYVLLKYNVYQQHINKTTQTIQ